MGSLKGESDQSIGFELEAIAVDRLLLMLNNVTALIGIFTNSCSLQALLSKLFRFLSVRCDQAKCCKLYSTCIKVIKIP